jgi:hypothetical protein
VLPEINYSGTIDFMGFLTGTRHVAPYHHSK